MGTWFWLNIPLALLFGCCWAGIPLWLTLTRWRAELSPKHAELAAEPGPAPVFAQPGPAVAHQTGSPAYAGVADAQPFPVRLRLPSEPGGAPATLIAAGPCRQPGIGPRITGRDLRAGPRPAIRRPAPAPAPRPGPAGGQAHRRRPPSPPPAAQPAHGLTSKPRSTGRQTHMTTPATGQPRHPLIRWATAPFRALRYLNQELLGAGQAMARSNRFPQPRPQAGPAEATHAQPAPVSKVLTGA